MHRGDCNTYLDQRAEMFRKNTISREWAPCEGMQLQFAERGKRSTVGSEIAPRGLRRFVMQKDVGMEYVRSMD